MNNINKLQKISDKTIFINTDIFYNDFNFDWLKPYVLLYDYILIPNRNPLSSTDSAIISQSKIHSKLDKILIYIEDYEEDLYNILLDQYNIDLDDNELYEKPMTVFFTKKNYYNKIILKKIVKKILQRGGINKKYAPKIEEIFLYDFNYEGGTTRTNLILKYLTVLSIFSGNILSLTAIPSIFDPVSAYIFELIYNNQIVLEKRVNNFQKICINNVPNFSKLNWSDILKLRKNKNRKNCISFLKQYSLSETNDSNNEINQSLWDLVNEISEGTSIPKTVLNCAIGTLPIPFINPYGVWTSYKKIKTTSSRGKKFGFLFFIAEIRNSVIQKIEINKS